MSLRPFKLWAGVGNESALTRGRSSPRCLEPGGAAVLSLITLRPPRTAVGPLASFHLDALGRVPRCAIELQTHSMCASHLPNVGRAARPARPNRAGGTGEGIGRVRGCCCCCYPQQSKPLQVPSRPKPRYGHTQSHSEASLASNREKPRPNGVACCWARGRPLKD